MRGTGQNDQRQLPRLKNEVHKQPMLESRGEHSSIAWRPTTANRHEFAVSRQFQGMIRRKCPGDPGSRWVCMSRGRALENRRQKADIRKVQFKPPSWACTRAKALRRIRELWRCPAYQLQRLQKLRKLRKTADKVCPRRIAKSKLPLRIRRGTCKQEIVSARVVNDSSHISAAV